MIKRLLLALGFSLGLTTFAVAANNPSVFSAPSFISISTPYPILNWVTPQMFGAKCDGTTDDSAAWSSAFSAVAASGGDGTAIFFPACPLGSVIKSNLSFTLSSGGPLQIIGVGPKSRIIFENSTGGIQIIGTCGLANDKIFLRDFSFEGGGSGSVGYGIWLNGVAIYGLDNIDINSGTQTITKGIYGSGAQQGHISGGYDFGSATGIYLNNCLQGGSIQVSSNGIKIGGGRAFNNTTAAVDFEGGAASDAVDGIYTYGGTHAIVNNVTSTGGGGGPNIVHDSYFEHHSGTEFEITAGTLFAHDNSHFSTTQYHVASGAIFWEYGSLIDGTGTFDSGSSVELDHDIINNAPTNNSGCGTSFASVGLIEYMNTGAGSIKTCPGLFAPSFLASGTLPTPSSGQGILGGTAVNGAYLEGNGSSCDALIGNISYNNLCIPHNTPHIQISGGLLNTSSAPSLTSCGSSPSVIGTNTGGVVTLGTSSPTGCTLTFSIAYPSYAWCTISPANSAANAITAYISAQNKTAFTLTLSAGTNSVSYNYNCNGQ